MLLEWSELEEGNTETAARTQLGRLWTHHLCLSAGQRRACLVVINIYIFSFCRMKIEQRCQGDWVLIITNPL